VEYNHVTPNYFALTGIPIVRGRDFTPAETHNATGVIVTESTENRLWPNKDPLGQSLRDPEGHLYSVIGIAKDAQVSHLGDSTSNYLYYPFDPESSPRSYTLVRYAAGYSDVAKEMRVAARSIDPNVSMDVTRLEDYLEVWRGPSRIVAGLSGTLGFLALLLCSIGVYGMVSYSVSRSVREIGIRLALGADRITVLRQVLWQAMRPVLIGGAAGLVLCTLVSGVLASMMFGIGAHDPVAFVCVPCFLFAIAAVAIVIPARRAMGVDPMIALRCE
jgi:ABC-type antimicrobial peptide transport system permease subunit